MRRPPHLAALLTTATLLSACAASGDQYPTLEIREAERVSGTFEVAPPVAPASLGSDIAASLPQVEAAARAAHAKFLSAVPNTQRLIEAARGTSAESNDWAAAEIALADLLSLRGETAVSLAELDLKYADATLRFEQRDAVGNAVRVVARLIAEEDRILAEIDRVDRP